MPDALWEQLEPILLADAPPKPTGLPRAPWRPILNGIMFRLRSGCQWNHLPDQFGDDSTIHRWCRRGVFAKLWAVLVDHCGELGGVHWDWQSADGRLGKKPGSGGKKVGPNPTDRAKPGTKQSVVVDRDGGPLGVVIAAANVNDHLLLKDTLDAIVVDRPGPTADRPQHLCLDAWYDNAASREVAAKYQYVPHIRPSRESVPPPRHRAAKPRRWVVERTLAWLSKCRAVLIRYDVHGHNYLGLIQLACAMLWYRRLHRLKSRKRVLR
ncbi:IS5 family transposase [Fimbriiglobus ruber]|uniref:IS5 family transposase n=1 Tax=Fimbriiglobus ruber TaxID=1908690 RepID=UPI000B4C10C0|nr:IS5 family transposase [Fimbriiglobus ruber]